MHEYMIVCVLYTCVCVQCILFMYFLYVCKYICVYICIFLHIRVHILCVYFYIHMREYICIYIYYVCMYVYVCILCTCVGILCFLVYLRIWICRDVPFPKIPLVVLIMCLLTCSHSWCLTCVY